MKNLILITAFLLALTSKVAAQDSQIIEINNPVKEATQNKNNEFKITAHEDLDINLKFSSKKEDTYNVIISNSKNKIVYSRENYTEGDNKIKFTMEEEEQYTVKLITIKPANVIVCVNQN